MDDHELMYRFNAVAASIARAERKVDFILAQLKLEYKEEQVLSPELKQFEELVKQGNTMAAIKEYRRVTGAPMPDAQAAVEALKAKLKLQ